ncbi:MAG: hypothetical protein RIS17_1688, partial [Pseudomonadota bacterium]
MARPGVRRFCLALLIATPALAAPEADPPAVFPQPRLEGRWLGLPGQDVAADLWWAAPAQRDALGPATIADALTAGAGVPGLVAGPAPGNGSNGLIVRHGRALPLALGRVALPATPALLPGLFDADLLLATPPGGVGTGGISLSLRRPGTALSGMGEFAAGGFGSRRALGRIDVPLDGVRVGLGGHLQHDLGWLTDPATGRRGNRGLRGGLSGMVDIDLTPTLTLGVTSLYARSEAGNRPAAFCDRAPANRCGDAAPDQRGDVALHDIRLAHAGDRLRLELAANFARQTGRIDLTAGGYRFAGDTVDSRNGVELLAEGDLGSLTLRAGAGFSDGQNRRDQVDTQAGAVIADRSIRQDDSRRHVMGQARLEQGGL